jgi:hypothetical protein
VADPALVARLLGLDQDPDTKNLHWLRGQLGNDLLDAVVISTGPRAYRREDGIAVVPAALLGP